MKRWRILIIFTIILFGSAFALSRSARDPTKFTGKWFHASDGSAYLFHNGIIISENHHIQTGNDEIFSGAYCFEKDKIYLFFLDANGVKEVQELQWISEKNGDTLCQNTEDGRTVVFCRNKVKP